MSSDITLILQILQVGLNLWSSLEKTKYISKITALEEQYRAETNKPLADRDDGVLDNIEFELRITATAWAAAASATNTPVVAGQAPA